MSPSYTIFLHYTRKEATFELKNFALFKKANEKIVAIK